MNDHTTSKVLADLVALGTALGVSSVASVMHHSTVAFDQDIFWSASDASTFGVASEPDAAEQELAMAEVRSARAILSSRQLRHELAFDTYLSEAAAAVKAYVGSSGTRGKELFLATALAVARTALMDCVSSLPSWLAIVQSSSPTGPFVSVPNRFMAREALSLEHEKELTAAELDTWLDLDSAGV